VLQGSSPVRLTVSRPSRCYEWVNLMDNPRKPKSKAEKAYEEKNTARADYMDAALGDIMGTNKGDAKASKKNVAEKSAKVDEAKAKFAEALKEEPKQRRARPGAVRLNATEGAAFSQTVATVGSVKTQEEIRKETLAASKAKTTAQKGTRSRDNGRDSL